MDGESFNFDDNDIEFIASMYASCKLSGSIAPIMHIMVSIPRNKKKQFYEQLPELSIIVVYIPMEVAKQEKPTFLNSLHSSGFH
ncbi:hypothetical protein QM042_09970 [Escherichia coli]